MSSKIITLYNVDISPPCRAVQIVAYLIDLKIEKRNMDLQSRENWSEWYLKLNSEHTVPTLDDKGSVIWDSHAICAYLVDKYAVNDSLYPKDLVLRAKCNQRLFFDAAILFQRMRAASYSVFKDRCSEISQDKIDAMYAAYDLLEAILIDDFLVGNSLTIADVCAMGSVTSMNLLYAPISPSKYPKISAWLERLKKQPFYVDVEQNGKYVVDYKQLVDQLKEANKSLAQQQTT